jgi:hypothetical protein
MADDFLELSYNLRFVEPHGRQLADPWSYRHSAIYQKFFITEHQSTFIVIHQPLQLPDNLQDIQTGSRGQPLSLHIRYIKSANHYWRDYLKYRSIELLSFVS